MTDPMPEEPPPMTPEIDPSPIPQPEIDPAGTPDEVPAPQPGENDGSAPMQPQHGHGPTLSRPFDAGI